MLRIIGGMYKGRHLKTPDGLDTRPMPDRVKESLFSILDDRLQDAAVLDVYCGCGGLGIEALSRGARHATFVESNPSVAAFLRDNLGTLALTPPACTILATNSDRALGMLQAQKARFDVIFMDPPFADLKVAVSRTRLSGELKRASLLLTDAGRIVLRIESDALPIPPDHALVLDRDRLYGRSRVLIFARRLEGPGK